MSIIIFAIVVLLIAGLLIWAAQMLTLIPVQLRQLLMVLIVILAAVAIANRAGVF